MPGVPGHTQCLDQIRVKSKDLCGHTQFLLRNVPENTGAHPVFIAKCAQERWGTPTFKNVTTSLIDDGLRVCIESLYSSLVDILRPFGTDWE